MTAPEQNTPVALITGGGQGIGRGIAARLVAEGHRVHVNVRSDVSGRASPAKTTAWCCMAAT